MQALQFIESIPRYALTKALGAVYRPAFWSPLSLLQLRHVPEPELPTPEWVRIRTRYGGICGSDLHTILLQDSPTLSALVSFPFTMGHENVGVLSEVGAQVRGFAVGERVVAEPLLSCEARGLQPCPACRQGERSRCAHFAEGALPPGVGIGTCSRTGGSWGEAFVAHRSQLHRVPDSVTDENALLIDTFCCALRPVRRNLPADHDTVLVLGAGAMGLCVVAALRACGCRARVLVVARYPFQGEMARRLGADEALMPPRAEVVPVVAPLLGARLRRPLLGQPLVLGGAPWVYECTGSRDGLDAALRLCGPGGTVVLLGLAATPRDLDWTPIWLKEITIKGTFWCSNEAEGGRQTSAYDLTLAWMANGRLDLSCLFTHRYTLADYRRALAETVARGRHRVIKSAFAFS
ncbi:MAG: zinc-dependent alcohol dehydrogenase [Anaerolineae bacterium]